ncbi:MAG: phosphoribosylamine--glycine ligase [Polyangiaceae bacterium]|nr:phosphoribosylamine--glycine ligase [Polyangiaceae bacterium]
MERRRRVLVVGSGGREHAIALRLLESESVGEVLVAPGNAGTATDAPGLPTGKLLRSVAGGTLEIAQREMVDLVVVGPEAPLVGGVVDELEAAGIPAFGPSRAAARLEGSKAFMKAFAARHGLPTARHRVVTDPGAVDAAVRAFAEPPVVKADGLCAGKGVVVAGTHEEAIVVATAMLTGEAFGAAGERVILEERLVGQEASVHVITDGERFVVLPPAQDHKRVGEGDQGPNTGGMGAYAPAPLVTEAIAARIERSIVVPTLEGMREEGTPFRGVLYAGLMITESGAPLLLEYNVRFGDPETQVLMSTIDGDLGEALAGAAQRSLSPDAIRPASKHALVVVLAASGYPGSPRTGDEIHGLEVAAALPDVQVFHAGTRRVEGRVLTAGGRILGVTASGATLRAARDAAYRGVGAIQFAGAHHRRDIGRRALEK